MLSKRLQVLATYLQSPVHFADIGSDHAYLPCYVCSKDLQAKAVAGEVNQGPYERAIQTVADQELADRISVRKGDGLAVISPGEVRQLTIAGMGGKLICQILNNDKDKLQGVERLILQPNVDAPLVREWLQTHQYKIVAEEIIEEDGYIYEVLISDYTGDNLYLTDKEILFGPFLLEKQNDVFRLKWKKEMDKRNYLINQMKLATTAPEAKITQLQKECRWIQEVLADDNG
ncbi:tRNA (adenine(22)-N(1))-methyltransferase TrmK [Gracilibacillus caseinilyticus]|uniref:tRNA (Adenine(22)-N(1))-methyltransferase TrmK n=1 Tax=Gracilibacillus caseinilyticus TaxID=2932256 RepID=A0ABY4EU84_9BACI|nr:class I SAM-dependent methyltransferase [Gracilibacillus caseinilyticus]UOQ47427.1 tRNA (adenine(22)-N(1))-methyltransferase TrmK [Gracilibacillus caseinilyticus]